MPKSKKEDFMKVSDDGNSQGVNFLKPMEPEEKCVEAAPFSQSIKLLRK